MIGTVLLLGNSYMYQKIESLYLSRIMEEQSVIASSNRMGLEYFLKSIDQSFQFLIADKLVGETLSRSYDDQLALMRARSDVKDQFFHCTTAQNSLDGYSYRSYLFLADYVPLASSYETATITSNRASLSAVCSNAAVKDEEWYLETLEVSPALNIFIAPGADELCLARSVQNFYYGGPDPKNGIGVMVTQVNRDQLGAFFQFSQVTPNTQVLLTNQFQEVLYEVNRGPESPATDFLTGIDSLQSMEIQYDGEAYIMNTRRLNWGLTLSFLTPYADINAQLKEYRQFYLPAALLTMGAVAAAALFVADSVTRPLIALSNTMKNVRDTRSLKPENFSSRSRDEIGELVRSFGTMVTEVNHLIEQVALQTAQQKETELQALQAQINPHFLYNAMDSVNWIALTNGQEKIADMVSQIAAILRYAVSRPDEMVALRNELENVGNYIALQNARYNGRIQLETDIEAGLPEWRLPKLLLQPLVENSILYGIADSQDIIHIRIEAHTENGYFYLTESDDGRGADSVMLNDYLDGMENGLQVRSGFGIRNVNERLQLKFRGAGRLRYQDSSSGGLQAVIRIELSGQDHEGALTQ